MGELLGTDNQGSIVIRRRSDPEAVGRILRSLPDWFGIEDAVVEYTDAAAVLESHLAVEDGDVVGVALLKRHRDEPTELFLLAVSAHARHRGVGSMLVQRVMKAVRAEGGRRLQVSTVGPSFDHDGYAATRGFYLSRGFVPVRELHDPTWGGPTIVLHLELP